MKLTAPFFDEEEIRLLRECLESGWVTQGPFTQRFESLFSARHQVAHAMATTSCTAALHLACAALGLGPGDEVVVPAFTWVTSAHCAEYVGARAVFADIELDTYNLSPEALEAAITPRTKAVVVVHLFGLAARMDEILAVARKHGLAIIEDAACAVGTTYAGRPVGSLGDLGCFSFHPRKVITTGEGGMVTTNKPALASLVGSLRNHGATGLPPGAANPPPPWAMSTFNRLGFNLRLSDIQAAVGVAQMAKLDSLLEERQGLAHQYLRLLSDIDEIVLPTVPTKCGHTFQSFVIRIAEGEAGHRNRVMATLAASGIQTRPGTHAVHRLGYYANRYNLRADSYPHACAAEDQSVTLPIFPGMTPEEQRQVAANVKKALTS